MRILIIKLSSLGDIIHTFPAITELKQHHPDANITWLVDHTFAEIPHWHPAVDQVISIPLRHIKKTPSNVQNWRHLYRSITAIRQQSYDRIIDPQGLWKSAILATIASGKSTGYNKNSARDKCCTPLYSRVFDIPKQQHAVLRSKSLLAKSCGYHVDKTWINYGIDPEINHREDTIMIFHGTTWDNKHYPLALWTQLIAIIRQQGYTVLLPWGTPSEKARAEILAQTEGVHILRKSTLSSIKDQISRAKGAIGVDTGFSHLAAATNTPCVAIYGPTHPKLASNFGHNQAQIHATSACAPCFKRHCRFKGTSDYMQCMHTIEPHAVWETLLNLWK